MPKTGGNSVQNALKWCSEDVVLTKRTNEQGQPVQFNVVNPRYKLSKHSRLHHYKQKLPEDVFQKFYKFGCIRNPWDRMISWYFSPNRGVTEWSRKDFVRLVKSVPRANNYFLDLRPLERVLYKLNLSFHSSRPLDSDVDFLMRFENLNEDFREICRVLDIPFKNLPKVNQSKRKHFSAYYDDELIELVGEKFSDEIKYGEYEFFRAD